MVEDEIGHDDEVKRAFLVTFRQYLEQWLDWMAPDVALCARPSEDEVNAADIWTNLHVDSTSILFVDVEVDVVRNVVHQCLIRVIRQNNLKESSREWQFSIVGDKYTYTCRAVLCRDNPW